MSISIILKILGGIILMIFVILYLNYQIDIRSAKERIISSQIIDTPCGTIEYSIKGDGPDVLIAHGAGGGFDQALFVEAPDWIGSEEFHFIAPSRFGYLRSLPKNGTPSEQANAYVCLLDRLNISKVSIVAASAGALSSMQFAIKYPDRLNSLVLIVPDSWRPPGAPEPKEKMSDSYIVKYIFQSDFFIWSFMKFAKPSMIEFFGVPKDVQISEKDNERIDNLMKYLLPLSQRIDGANNDGNNAAPKERYSYENITVPTLIIDAEDAYTFPGSKYAAEHIPNARLVSFEKGGHLLIGHTEEVRKEVASFLKKGGNKI